MNKLYLSKSILGEEAMVEMGKYDYTFNCRVNKACCCLYDVWYGSGSNFQYNLERKTIMKIVVNSPMVIEDYTKHED